MTQPQDLPPTIDGYYLLTTRADLMAAFRQWYLLLRTQPEQLIVEHGPDFAEQASDQLIDLLLAHDGLKFLLQLEDDAC